MPVISIQVSGTDGSPHGHGGFFLDPEEWDVTQKQYLLIKENYDAGETDLLAMDIYGLKTKCRNVIEEQRDYIRQGFENSGLDKDDVKACMDDVQVFINVVDLDDEQDSKPVNVVPSVNTSELKSKGFFHVVDGEIVEIPDYATGADRAMRLMATLISEVRHLPDFWYKVEHMNNLQYTVDMPAEDYFKQCGVVIA